MMRVATWNVQHGRPNPDGPPDLSRGLPALAALAADVVGLQELDRGFERTGFLDQVAMVAATLGGTAFHVPAFERGEGSYGNALVVRGDLADAEVLVLPGRAEPRSAGLARVEVAGAAWSVAVTHLSTDDATAGEQLEAVLDALDGRPEPRVLLGDLNLEVPAVLRATDARGYVLLDGPPTWNARRTPRRRLDHVAVRGATITASAVHQLPVSDHLAVSADLQEASPQTSGYRSSTPPSA